MGGVGCPVANCLPLSGWAGGEHHAPVLPLNLVRGDRLHGGPAPRLAAGQVEAGAVVGAGDAAALDGALYQRPVGGGAAVAEGVDVTLQVEQRHLVAPEVDDGGGAAGKVLDRRDPGP